MLKARLISEFNAIFGNIIRIYPAFVMDRKEILKKSKEILTEIQQQIAAFEEQNYQISDIELDLFLANAKFLVDHAHIMKRLQELPQPPEIVPEVPSPSVVDSAAALPIVEEAIYSAPPETPILLEESKPSLNELLADKADATLATKFETEVVEDLKSIINLNDKLVFVKDLFSGYSLAYQEALDALNRMSTLAEAKQYLNENYAEQNKWLEHEATVARFYLLLSRRYLK